MSRLYSRIGKDITAVKKDCPTCKGSGEHDGKSCSDCHGSGKVTAYK